MIFSTTDLVIGPFTNSFVETAGELLIDKIFLLFLL